MTYIIIYFIVFFILLYSFIKFAPIEEYSSEFGIFVCLIWPIIVLLVIIMIIIDYIELERHIKK